MALSDQSEFVFGPGSAWAVLNTFMDGTAPAVLQPRKFDVMQEFTVNFGGTIKRLMGQNIFPRAIGVAEGKVECKIKLARFDSGIWQLRFAEPAGTTTGQKMMADDLNENIPASTPFTVTPVVPNAGTWATDWGVRYGDTGLPLTAVASAPATGQYSVAAGVYTFATADASRPVVISFEYTVTTGVTLTLLSHVQGSVALSSIRYQGEYGGRNVGVYLPNVVGATLNVPTKQGDFGVPEMDFEAFADASNKVAYLYLAS